MIQLIDKNIRKCIIYLIKLYQITLSPLIGNRCRFYPTCSGYSIEILERFNVLKSLFLIIYRLLSCNPWGRYGYDPVTKYFSLKRFFISRFYGKKRKFYNFNKAM